MSGCVICGDDIPMNMAFANYEVCDFECHSRLFGRDEGAAVAFGLLGMATEIGRIRSIQACTRCGKASTTRIYPRPYNASDWVCRRCADLAWLAEGQPAAATETVADCASQSEEP